MKEVIEYILAFLVILSVLPIYNYVMTTLYAPPQLEVDESVLAAFSEQIIDFLEEQAIYGNLTSPIVDLKSLIENRFNYITKDYMFNIKIVSAGIEKITINETSVYIYTIYTGNVTLFIIYSDYSFETTTATQPLYVFNNKTFIYKVQLHKVARVIFALSILETGTYRFISYYCDPNVNKVYIGNYNGKFSIITNQDLAYQTLPNGEKGVKLIIISYSKGKFQVHSEDIRFGNITAIILPWDFLIKLILFGELEYIVEYDDHNIGYYAIKETVVSMNNINYTILSGVVLDYETLDSFRYTYDIYSNTKEVDLIDREFIRTECSFMKAPIYNLPISIVEDASGNKYVGIWYPHELTIGYTIPSTLPTKSITLIRRLGSVDYYITITLWRRTG